MTRNTLGWIWTLIAFCSSATAYGQLTTAEAGRLGLEPRWSAALNTSLKEPAKTSIMIWQSAAAPRTSIDISAEGKQIVIETTTLGADGNPLGLEGAKAQAETLAKRMRYAGLKPVITERTSPNIYLLVTASDGSIEMLDAETGKSLWTTQVGKTNQPTYPSMMNDSHVIVTNGSTIYALETTTGKSLFSFRCEDAPGSAAGEINGRIFVPTLTGKFVGYLTDDRTHEPSRFVYGGRSVVRAGINRTNNIVAVPVEPRYVFFFSIEPTTKANSKPLAPIATARLEAQSPIFAPPVPYEDSFIVCSRSGEIFRINPTAGGDIKWVSSTGSVLYSSPLVAQNGVFVISDSGELLAYDATSGSVLPGWEDAIGGMKQVLSVTKDRVFVRNKSGQLAAFDFATGKLIGEVGTGLVHGLANPVSDRVYVVSNHGTIQCLAQKGATSPLIHHDVQAPAAEKEPKEKPKPEINRGSESDADNPFGGSDAGMEAPAGGDPFGDG
jgi:outer membrane protein assembly factor BamB